MQHIVCEKCTASTSTDLVTNKEIEQETGFTWFFGIDTKSHWFCPSCTKRAEKYGALLGSVVGGDAGVLTFAVSRGLKKLEE